MEKTFAIVKNNIVENVIVWDGVCDYTESQFAIESTELNQAWIGLGCVDGIFEQPIEELPLE